jgi:hypothetical protein
MANITLYRTCQECDKINIHNGKNPSEMSEAEMDRFRNKACKYCKSEALDYGTTDDPRSTNRVIEDDDDLDEYRRENPVDREIREES